MRRPTERSTRSRTSWTAVPSGWSGIRRTPGRRPAPTSSGCAGSSSARSRSFASSARAGTSITTPTSFARVRGPGSGCGKGSPAWRPSASTPSTSRCSTSSRRTIDSSPARTRGRLSRSTGLPRASTGCRSVVSDSTEGRSTWPARPDTKRCSRTGGSSRSVSCCVTTRIEASGTANERSSGSGVHATRRTRSRRGGMSSTLRSCRGIASSCPWRSSNRSMRRAFARVCGSAPGP